MRAFTYCFGIFTCLFGIACVVFELQMMFRVIVAILVVILIPLVLKYSKCSNCKEYEVSINPFSKKFGVCKKCNHKECINL